VHGSPGCHAWKFWRETLEVRKWAPLPGERGRQGVRDPPLGNLVGGVVVWWGASGEGVLNWRAAFCSCI